MVVAAGLTVTEPLVAGVTVPIPLLITAEFALLVDQLNVLAFPTIIELGEPEKEPDGAAGGGGGGAEPVTVDCVRFPAES